MLDTECQVPAKILLMLVGLKGSGKTFMGQVLEQAQVLKFLKIEPIFLELLHQQPNLTGIALEKTGFTVVLQHLDELASTHPLLCIESTGTAYTFAAFLSTLRQKFRVYLIRVHAPLEVCLERVMARDSSQQIPVTPQRVRAINEVALQVNLPWDLEIDNTQFLTELQLIQIIQDFLQIRIHS